MERGFVALSLDNEEEEVVQVQREPDPVFAEEDFWERGERQGGGNSYEGADLGRSKREEKIEGGLGCRIDHILGMNLEGPWAIRRFQYVLKLYNPQVVFIMETKLSKIRMKNVRRKCGFLNGIDIEADG
ncbi:hypothetical protein Gotri_019430 [Gossypium trilobum]|uniref:Uncharacterized protein n=1 Tax=Gossypium trilobum TaxID=34281 RepID=A0A7J9EDM1_9ROSI|nr:hypothetical protein [Gossypium trilobum]